MGKRDVLTKILAIAGTVLVWFPILAPILFSVVAVVYWRMVRFDFLMPAELFSFAMAGGCLLVWAAWRARLRLSLIGCELGVAIASLVGSQGLAVVTGLASGATELGGAWRSSLDCSPSMCWRWSPWA
jgi:hypothetical protein